jgi:hypothetical protein
MIAFGACDEAKMSAFVHKYCRNTAVYQFYFYGKPHIYTPESGRHTLPREILKLCEALEKHQADRYHLSEATYERFNQRLVEGCWPSKPSPEPQAFALFLREEISSFLHCQPVEEIEGVVLGLCRH